MNSIKRKEESVISETPAKKKKFSRGARKRWNKKLRQDRESDESDVRLDHDIDFNIIFDPSKHRTQHATRNLSQHDKAHYLENEWTCVDLSLSDRISSKSTKTYQNISARDLLIETLIKESRSCPDSLEPIEIPEDFFSLIDTNIIGDSNNNLPINDINKRLWVAFGRWLGLKRQDGLIKRKHVRHHLRLRWNKLRRALNIRNSKDFQAISDTAIARNTRKKKVQLILSARNNFQSIDGLVNIHYILKPECISDMEGRALIHLEILDDQIAVTKATNTVNEYYFHTLNNPSHRSDEFWSNFIEHFGAYTLYNTLPYTSSNTASSHNIDHQECVNSLLLNLRPLSDMVNRFLHDNYGEMYNKLQKLSWGPFAPRSFGVFPMIAINYNTISDYHWDEHDDPNSLCCLVALGDFEGGELCFPQLQIVVPLRPGQVVAFSSRFLLHGNFPVTRGIRHSIVYFVHGTFFHHKHDITSINSNSNADQDLNNAQSLNSRIRLVKPRKSQIEIPDKASDKRRGRIDLRRARRGLKAEDPLSDTE